MYQLSAMKFKNLQQLFDTFKDEKTCRDYLEEQRWNGSPECPFCGSTKVYRTNRGFKCADKFCAKKFSVTVGTIYENSKVGLRTFFAALYLISSSKKGISSLQLSRQLGITQKSAWFVLHRIRELLKDKAPQVLSTTVELDESYIGGKNANKHKHKRLSDPNGPQGKTMVFGILDREQGVRTFVVNGVDRETLFTLIKQNVSKDAEIISDNFPTYRHLADEGFNHTIIKKEPYNYHTEGKYHTNCIEGYWSIMKRGIYGIYHQVSPKHLQRYCDEFAARYNTRSIQDNERFEWSVKKSEGRLKYNQLIGKQ
jgi:transposase-like protein